ncbi:PEP-CTERM sorting domain-containing protein [Limobrevibacterium gyesilva]|uniref:PEP-CTERM sorting domain-containing protein n=1 Tax=Limobrevibacterium gyesilva TaxID=2991712 RepID=A0AA42CFT5_9PROT|nr:PEP-CTERM sorting domain-containing protein [Limobrevibacterium gyesilva]MCW3473120.1 PEP-CTERM sorting domain-containing protein [Limobrevibacterium gyesilva]
MMRIRHLFLVMALSAFGAAYATPAAADTATFVLTQDACSGTCGTGPFGTIVLTEVSPFQVDVLVTLIPTAKFVATGAGDSLAFNLLSNPVVTITNITPGFASVASPKGMGGSYGYGVDCQVPSGCGSGASNPNPGPLAFSVIASTAIQISSFIANGAGIFFSSDIIGPNGKTGNVGARAGTVTVTPVPEPASMALIASGLAGIALVRRRRART